jgi:hypothetical protein
MLRIRRDVAVILLVAVMACAGVPAVAQEKGFTTGAFTKVNKIETELERGRSTKLDVRRLLGTPKGYGQAVLPPQRKEHEVWYYEDIELTKVKFESASDIRADVRQQILLIFFLGEVFDGFMWYSNAVEAQPLE